MQSAIQAADPLRWKRYLLIIRTASLDDQSATTESVVLVPQQLPGLPTGLMGETAFSGTTSLVAQASKAATLSRSRVAQLPEAYSGKPVPTSFMEQQCDELVTAHTRPPPSSSPHHGERCVVDGGLRVLHVKL